jgi:pimeloyl-ACP methyl ester carboxylesterase
MREETVEAGGCDVLVERFGAGPPLVVLHGEEGPIPARSFFEALGGHFEVHAPRHPGWRGSSRPRHVSSVRDVALVQQEYLESLGQPAAVVGLSFGGWVAAEIAANAPGLISALVLVSPIGIKVGGREDRDFVDIYLTPPGQRTSVYRAALDDERRPDLSNEWLLEKATADEAVARYCWKPYMHDPTLAGRLRRIKSPTVIVSGRGDAFVLNPSYFETYAQLIAGARQVQMDGGHRLEEEQPRALAEVVRTAIQSKRR